MKRGIEFSRVSGGVLYFTRKDDFSGEEIHPLRRSGKEVVFRSESGWQYVYPAAEVLGAIPEQYVSLLEDVPLARPKVAPPVQTEPTPVKNGASFALLHYSGRVLARVQEFAQQIPGVACQEGDGLYIFVQSGVDVDTVWLQIAYHTDDVVAVERAAMAQWN